MPCSRHQQLIIPAHAEVLLCLVAVVLDKHSNMCRYGLHVCLTCVCCLAVAAA